MDTFIFWPGGDDHASVLRPRAGRIRDELERRIRALLADLVDR
jgi:hypothetical protein